MDFAPAIVRCPLCRGLSQAGSPPVPKDFYMLMWSDGWVAPAPREGPLVRCAVCGIVSHRGRFESLGTVQPTFRVMLTGYGDRRIDLLRLLRKWSGGSPLEVRAAIDSLPCVVARELDPEKVDGLRTDLEGLGAAYRVEIEEEGSSSPREWLHAPQAEVLDDIEALRTFLASASDLERLEEADLRFHLYLAANHPYRWWDEDVPYGEGLPWVPVGEREAWQRENVRRLEEILDPEDPPSRVLLATMAREAGDFTAALALLQPILRDKSDPVADGIAELARQGISEVQVIAAAA